MSRQPRGGRNGSDTAGLDTQEITRPTLFSQLGPAGGQQAEKRRSWPVQSLMLTTPHAHLLRPVAFGSGGWF